MRSEGVRVVAASLALLAGLACAGGDGDGSAAPADCGVPTPDPRADPALLPQPFLLDGDAEVASAGRRRGGVTAVLSTPLSVQDAVPVYRKAIGRAGFEIVGEDNEGFEAELYFKQGERLGAIQLRRTLCDDVIVVFVNVVKGDFAMPIVSTPSPSPP
ncbi:MAG TPA: hypothetical protein VHN37_03115 [Actinomycetota bacterium]|nr:hypothetical protein [Actinomycetota bacterium]